MHPFNTSFVLGTAQLGLPYGIANKDGQPNQDMATAIVCEAWENGIREFDTAQGYGNSEQVLGKAIVELGVSEQVLVITKFDPKLNHLDVDEMSMALDRSIQRLGILSLEGIMLHREEMLSLWELGLSKILRDFIASGRVRNVGVSVYSPEKAIQALDVEGIDMVQLPTNILDRRFEKAGVFELAEKKGKSVYIRSIFLQGLILMKPEDLPERMAFVRPVLEKLEGLSLDLGLTRQEMALGYIKMEMPSAKVVLGVDKPDHVKEDVQCWEREFPSTFIPRIKSAFDDVSERILDPTLWPK